jgi:hypothetical protein
MSKWAKAQGCTRSETIRRLIAVSRASDKNNSVARPWAASDASLAYPARPYLSGSEIDHLVMAITAAEAMVPHIAHYQMA